jgi:SOS-response transcriptional repressor LexA
MLKPTDRQAVALRFIDEHVRVRGCPPTLREIGEHMCIRSNNGVNDHLRALERKGYLVRRDREARALHLTARAANYLGRGEAQAVYGLLASLNAKHVTAGDEYGGMMVAEDIQRLADTVASLCILFDRNTDKAREYLASKERPL